MVLQDVKEKAMSLERIKLLPVQDAMVVLRRTASAALNYITRCGTPEEVRPASTFFDNKVAELVCDIQRLQKSELTAEMIDEILSPLLMGGTGIVATEPVTAAGIPFLASMARALPTVKAILGEAKAFAYFEPSLKEAREKHPCLRKSYPESASSFAAKFAEGATGKSGRKVSMKGLQAKWAGILHKHRSKLRIEGYEQAASSELGQAKLTAALAARRRGTHEKFTAAVDKGTVLTNEEARVAFRYHFSLKLMESLPTKCLCGHRVGDGSHLLVCKRVNSGQIAAHDDAVRRIGAELNDYGVVVRYEQRADRVKGKERKRTDLELSFDGKRTAVDFTVPNTLKLKQRTPGLVYEPYEVREEAENLKNNKYVNLARNKYHEFVPLVAESLGGLGKAAIKLFAEIARSQASSRHPVGHILRRLIDISQIAVQRGNFRRLQHAVSLCSLDDPFSNLPISREHLRAMDAVARSE